MTREEAKLILKEMHDSMHDGYMTHLVHGGKQDETMENDIEALSVAIEALRQQIPQKVVRQHGNYDCPVCNKPAMTVSARRKKYCDFCGQAIDWSEADG